MHSETQLDFKSWCCDGIVTNSYKINEYINLEKAQDFWHSICKNNAKSLDFEYNHLLCYVILLKTRLRIK